MRALEARRKRRHSWMAGIGAAVVVIAVAAGITLAAAGSSGGGSNPVTGGAPRLKLSSLASLGTLRLAGPPRRAGARGVPNPPPPPPAPTAPPPPGTARDR